MIVVALGFPAALALFLLLMGRLEGALFPAPREGTGPTDRSDPAPGPVPTEARP